MPKDSSSRKDRLRKRAESSLRLKVLNETRQRLADPERLLRELELHEVELQMQNEELRAAQAAIMETRDRFSELYNLAPVGYVTLDRSGTITEANLTVARLLGVERKQLLGRPIMAFMRKQYADLLYRHLSQAFAHGSTFGCDLVIRSQDSSRADRDIAVHMSCLVVSDENGEQDECRATLTDLSDLRDAQAGQLASQSRSTALLDTAADAIVCSDASGKIESFNRAAERLFGYARDEVTGRNIRMLVAEPFREQFGSHVLPDASMGEADTLEPANREIWGVKKDGSLVLLEFGMGQWQDRGYRKFTTIFHDLSERKRAEVELRQSEQLFRSLFETSPIGKCIVTAEGRVHRVNAAFTHLLGVGAAECAGLPFVDLIHPDDRSLVTAGAFGQAGGDPAAGFDLELRYVSRGGGVVLGHSILSWSCDAAGGRQYGVMLIQDVTERRRAEAENARLQAQLSQARKMEALGTLASGVAHDFSNLLMGISGCARIALDALAPESPARLYLDEIKQSADRGASIPKRLLQFSRKGSVEFSVFELNHVVAGAQRMLERLLGEDIEVRVRLAAMDSLVLSDAGQMEQVLLNLAVNARDAMPTGGELVIETCNQTVASNDERAIPAGEYVTLTVSDRGLGMSDEVRERIFEPFFTTKEMGRGTGLGLSTVHGIIEQAGGHIRVVSRPNQGTSFEILLPKADRRGPITPVTPEPEWPDRPKGHGTILLVEDEHAVRLATRYYLERGGYRVLEAGSGVEAIECCTKYPGRIDLLLSDVVLPQMGGHHIFREFAKFRAGCPVLFVSAHPAEQLEREGRLPPGASLLPKPFGPEVLLARIREKLAGREAGAGPVELARVKPEQAPGGAILIVDDEPAARLAISEHFRELGWVVLESGDGRQALELYRRHQDRIAVLLIDYSLPNMRGDALAEEVKKICAATPFVYMSGYPGLKLDPPGTLLQKPLNLDRISETVARVVRAAARR